MSEQGLAMSEQECTFEEDKIVAISTPRFSKGETRLELEQRFGKFPETEQEEKPKAVQLNECYKCEGGTGMLKKLTEKK